MADTKTTALTRLQRGAAAGTDVFPIVDVSDTTQGASGTLKKMRLEDLPGSLLTVVDQSVFAATIVDTFVYDTSKDSDGGAWRDRCSHTSWENETLSGNWLGSAANETAARAISGATTGSYYYDTTAAGFYTLNAGSGKAATYRGNVAKFPAKVLITVEAARVIIWDLTQAGAPMWMVWLTNFASLTSGGSLTSAAAVNGIVCIGVNTNANYSGLMAFRFVRDDIAGVRLNAYSNAHIHKERISERTDTNDWAQTYLDWGSSGLVSALVNDVAMTVLPSAPVDVATGLPVPTIAVATDGGVSVITDSGSVWDIVESSGPSSTHKVAFTADNRLMFAYSDTGAAPVDYAHVQVCDIPSADVSINYYYTRSGVEEYNYSAFPGIADLYADALYAAVPHASAGLSAGMSDRLAIIHRNPASPTDGMVAHVTKDYNTGWMVGDIKLAALADTTAETLVGGTDADRSVNANDLTVNGSITKAAVASGAALMGYSGFSAANYLEQPYNADLDFGTGDFCIMGWVYLGGYAGTNHTILHRCLSGSTGGLLFMVASTGEVLMFATNGTGYATSVGSAAGTMPTAGWVFLAARRSGTTLSVHINAVSMASGTVSGNLTYANAVTRVGLRMEGTYPHAGSLALLRATATAPSDEQLRHIYETERPMFDANAQCCLAGTSNAVTALAYDEETDLLHVGTSYGRSAFKGLVRVSSEATAVGAITALSAADGIIAQGGATAVDVYVPAQNLREELARTDEHAAGGIEFFDFTATASQTDFALDPGWEIVAVYQQGALKRETTSWTREFNGFYWTMVLGTGATVSDWISIMARRV